MLYPIYPPYFKSFLLFTKLNIPSIPTRKCHGMKSLLSQQMSHLIQLSLRPLNNIAVKVSFLTDQPTNQPAFS